ncbi:MAG: SIS domain-containing protein [Patescibacteria group bacterium]
MTDVNVFIETFTHKVTTALCSVSVEQIKSAIAALRACCTRSGRVYVFGNGGSYAMAGHWSSDLNKAILYRRGRKRTQSDFCVVRLPMSDAELTAWANDSGYDSVFAGPLMHLVRPADLVIALSCSGNSLNVLNAVNVAKQLAVPVIGFTGFDGGELKKISDISIHVQTEKSEYAAVESVHATVLNLLTDFFNTNDSTLAI